jgi:hypothetical protein
MYKMNKYSKYVLILTLFSTFLFVKCGKDDVEDTSGIAEVFSFGPSPALRGGELKFIGKNLNKVTSIVLPNNVEVKNFKSSTPELIILTIPEATVDGKVTVKASTGDLPLKSSLKISEPIAITAFSPAIVRPGDKVTITGTYLNLIKEVTFASKKAVTKFDAQSQTTIELKVPLDAQSGKLLLSNGLADPIIIESETDLNVKLPVIAKISPNPIKAGQTVTIEGTDLDLSTSVKFGGAKVSPKIVSKTATKIEAEVNADAQDGKIALVVASLLEASSTDALLMVVPTISKIDPIPAKNGQKVTISGKDLDLVTGIKFSGNKDGTITKKAADAIEVTIPIDATEGSATLNTQNAKSVTSQIVTLVKPTIASFTPSSTQALKPIVVTGTHLDLVKKVFFAGDKSLDVNNTNATSLTITVPSGTATGAFTLETSNGTQVKSANPLTLFASNVPSVTGFPKTAKPGQLITLTGTKMNLLTDVIFPNNIKASTFGTKTDTKIEVVVPLNVKIGVGKIKFMTIDNEVSETDDILFAGVDPVKDPNLVFFNFDGKNAWWGKMQGNVRKDAESVDGTSYGFVNESLNGWTDMFWRNSANDFPGSVVGTKVSEYVLKMDINIKDPLTGGNLKLRLNGDEGDFWYGLGPDAPTAGKKLTKTDGWETITIKITDFKDNYGWGDNSIKNLNVISKEFGMAWDNGASKVNILIDNVRFEKL